jgi:hypothetical protein
MKEHPAELNRVKTDGEGDTKMGSPPLARTRPPLRGHSPPRGPRNATRYPPYHKIPTGPAASLQLPTKPDWNRRRAGMSTSVTAMQDLKPVEPEVTLPVIPVYTPKPVSPEIYAEVFDYLFFEKNDFQWFADCPSPSSPYTLDLGVQHHRSA